MENLTPLELQQQVTAYQAQLAAVSQQLAEVRLENTFLRQKVDSLARQLFGKKSEQLDPQQLQMLFQELSAPGPATGNESGPQVSEDAARPASAPAKKRAPRGPRIPAHLKIVEEIIVPEPVRACPEAWRQIGEEISERLDYQPGQFICQRTVRPKYVKIAAVDGAPVIAALPACLLERSLATPGLLAQILVSKYVDHLPLYRQEAMYWSRHGVWLPRQTMAEWVGLAAFWLRPIAEAIRQEVLAGGYVQIDETPIRYLEPGHGQAKRGYFWTCSRPGGDVFFHWEISRAAECLERVLPADFQGTVQCDAYRAYQSFAARRGLAITLAGCLAHSRRKFFEAEAEAPRFTKWLLGEFQKLYVVEKCLRENRAGPGERLAERQKTSRPIMDRLERVLRKLVKQRRFLPRSGLGSAIAYALENWKALCVFLQDGRVEIDNNLVENAIRPTAVGKKNWLFIGEAKAGDRSADLYTIVESCRRRGLDPYAYLRDVLERLPRSTQRQVADLTPAAWAREKASAELAVAA